MSGREPGAVDVGGRTAAPDAPPVPMFARLLPAGSYAGRSRALVLRSATAARRTWLAIVSGIFEPVFYLVAMGQGLGSLVGALPGPDGNAISYSAFIAPGLLAAAAMNGAVFDSTYNVFFKLKYNRFYDAVLATPLGPIDIALGEIAWALVRGGVYAIAFLAVMGGFGLLLSPWALLALPAALVVAFGFAAVGMAATTYMRSWQDFDLVTLAILPQVPRAGAVRVSVVLDRAAGLVRTHDHRADVRLARDRRRVPKLRADHAHDRRERAHSLTLVLRRPVPGELGGREQRAAPRPEVLRGESIAHVLREVLVEQRRRDRVQLAVPHEAEEARAGRQLEELAHSRRELRVRESCAGRACGSSRERRTRPRRPRR